MDVEFKDSSGTIHTCGVEVIPSQMASIFLRNHEDNFYASDWPMEALCS